jgi:hypothetical protein
MPVTHERVVSAVRGLETAERIVRVKVEQAAASVGLVARARAPLAAATTTTMLHVGCSSAVAAQLLWVPESVVDERLHANSAHGVKEVLTSRGTGF